MSNQKDLGIKIGTKKEALWTRIKEASEQAILQGEADLLIHGRVIALAEVKIREEERKSNK